MENIHRMVVNFIIQYFERIKLPVQPDKQVFTLMVRDRVFKQFIFKGEADILFGKFMLESGRIAFNDEFGFLLHAFTIPQNEVRNKRGHAKGEREGKLASSFSPSLRLRVLVPLRENFRKNPLCCYLGSCLFFPKDQLEIIL